MFYFPLTFIELFVCIKLSANEWFVMCTLEKKNLMLPEILILHILIFNF